MKWGCAFVHAIASRFVSKNRSTTMALSWLAVRPHRRAALRLITAGPVSTAVQARSGKTTLLPYGIRLGSTAQCPECNRRPVLAKLEPSPAQQLVTRARTDSSRAKAADASNEKNMTAQNSFMVFWGCFDVVESRVEHLFTIPKAAGMQLLVRIRNSPGALAIGGGADF